MGRAPDDRTIGFPVAIDVGLEREGEVRWSEPDFRGYYTKPKIVMRRFDQRVLLHEFLHAVVGTEPQRLSPPGSDGHEDFVRHVTRALYEAGWRYLGPYPAEHAHEWGPWSYVFDRRGTRQCSACGQVDHGAVIRIDPGGRPT